MPYDTPLTQDEYNRMVYVTLACSEEKCLAERGEPCRSMVRTKRNDGSTKIPHFWRRVSFTTWKKENPEKYLRLVNQILAQRSLAVEEADTYYTMVG